MPEPDEEQMEVDEEEVQVVQNPETEKGENPEDVVDLDKSESEKGTPLRSSKAEEASRAMLKGYGQLLKGTEEYAMEFLSNQVQHPVFSTLRDLTTMDINSLIGNNKLKKRNGTLEQSVIHLGLIDYIAVTVDNPLYTEKHLRNVPAKIQKIMLDFKNIIGSWGLSDNPLCKRRYEIVMKYLRGLVHHFKAVNFDEGLIKILDSIETEIGRNRHNYDKIRAISFTNSNATSSQISSSQESVRTESDVHAVDGEEGIKEVNLNISLEIDENEPEEEETPLSPSSVTWAHLRPPPENQKKTYPGKSKKDGASGAPRKKSRLDLTPDDMNGLSQSSTESGVSGFLSPSTGVTPPRKKSTPKAKKSRSRTGLQFSSVPETISESPLKPTNVNSKPLPNSGTKFLESNSNKNCRVEVIEIESKNRADATNNNKTTTSGGNNNGINKPKVNAFALLMSRSREIADEKKQKKLASAAQQRPLGKLPALKTST